MSRTARVDYGKLLGFRVALRQFERWSEEQARSAGLTPAQHQLLLCIRGSPTPTAPTISDIADNLMLRHHSAVELIDRAETSGLVSRRPDPDDARMIRVELTPAGDRVLDELTEAHVEELRRLEALLRPTVSFD